MNETNYEIKAVNSRALKGIGYTKEHGMVIEYPNGAKYKAEGVTELEYKKLIVAESIGKEINQMKANGIKFIQIIEKTVSEGETDEKISNK